MGHFLTANSYGNLKHVFQHSKNHLKLSVKLLNYTVIFKYLTKLNKNVKIGGEVKTLCNDCPLLIPSPDRDYNDEQCGLGYDITAKWDEDKQEHNYISSNCELIAIKTSDNNDYYPVEIIDDEE